MPERKNNRSTTALATMAALGGGLVANQAYTNKQLAKQTESATKLMRRAGKLHQLNNALFAVGAATTLMRAGKSLPAQWKAIDKALSRTVKVYPTKTAEDRNPALIGAGLVGAATGVNTVNRALSAPKEDEALKSLSKKLEKTLRRSKRDVKHTSTSIHNNIINALIPKNLKSSIIESAKTNSLSPVLKTYKTKAVGKDLAGAALGYGLGKTNENTVKGLQAAQAGLKNTMHSGNLRKAILGTALTTVGLTSFQQGLSKTSGFLTVSKAFFQKPLRTPKVQSFSNFWGVPSKSLGKPKDNMFMPELNKRWAM